MATQAQLDEAKAAYHELLLGKRTVSIQFNGRKRDFAPADRQQLANYIASLEDALGVTSTRRGRPARVC